MSEITVSLFPDMWGHFAYTAWKMFSARASWQRQRGFCFGKGGSDPFSIAGLGGGCIFSLTSSLPYSAVLLDMERNFTLMFVVKICLSSCYQLSAQLGNKMPQGSQETKCSVILQTKKKSHICFLHESFQSSTEEDKKPPLNDQCLPRWGISTNWAGAGTWAEPKAPVLVSDLLWGFSCLGLQQQVPATSERRCCSADERLVNTAEKNSLLLLFCAHHIGGKN